MTSLHVGGEPAAVRFELGATEARAEAARGGRITPLGRIELLPGRGRLRAWVERPGGIIGVYQVVLRRID